MSDRHTPRGEQHLHARSCIAYEGMPVLSDLYAEFLDNGDQGWLCGACTKPRGITEKQVGNGATMVGAAMVVEEVAGGAKTVAFA